MAGRAVFMNFYCKSIAVAVGCDAFYMLIMSGSFAFSPKLLTGAGPEAGLFFFKTDLQTFLIHICQGKDFSGVCVNNYRRYKAFIIKFQIIYIYNSYILTFILLSLNSFLSSGIRTSPKWKTEAANPASISGISLKRSMKS